MSLSLYTNGITSDSMEEVEAVQWPGGGDNLKSAINVLTEDLHSVSMYE